MDRSFLSDENVIQASRDFVCIRLATYEDAEEATWLKAIFTGRSGELENTVFCLLAPDGNTRLSRAGRGPQMAFRNPRDMASQMKKTAAEYPASQSNGTTLLPQMKNFRLALNVAECDSLPLVVCFSEDKRELKSLQDKLAPLTFSGRLAGRFIYASVAHPSQLASIDGEKPESGYLVIAPGEFGVDGNIRKRIDANLTGDVLADQLVQFADGFRQRDKDHHQHVRKGNENGVDWKTEIPVTDPMSNRARDREKGKRGDRKRRRER